ncbi:hypothetical protein SKAU_G00128910 [Synaphobranchus kaupii]|uniref:Uncharacterized protein n=1 Tax=Synaphobranchus kaupii TaxID=118154 RepID=A0A9Q1FQ03_SYNKA|nr:hypothetical protein SKAU_G00128910 [Synaphobranchus kaupii]
MPTSEQAPGSQLGQRICQPPRQQQKAMAAPGHHRQRSAAACDQDQGRKRKSRPLRIKGQIGELHMNSLSSAAEGQISPRTSTSLERRAAPLTGSLEVSGTSSVWSRLNSLYLTPNVPAFFRRWSSCLIRHSKHFPAGQMKPREDKAGTSSISADLGPLKSLQAIRCLFEIGVSG